MAKKNRILMLLENNPFPQDARVRREAESLAAAGYDVSVIAPKKKGQPARELVSGVHVYRFWAPAAGEGAIGFIWEYGYSLLATCWLTVQVFFTRGFDVIHSHNPPDLYVLIALLFKPFGKRFVFDHHDLSPEMYLARFRGKGNKLLYALLVFFEKLSCRAADLVIATNESYRDVERQRGKVTSTRSAIVRNGPDLDRVRWVEPDAELRAKASTIIGYVGVMGFQDGLEYLLRALKHLRDDLGHHDFYCVLIGKGDALHSLRELTTELALQDHVWWTGFIPDEDLIRYLSTADIVVDPDPHNDFNDRSTMIKMMEYMALSKPIVAFDLTEHRVSAQDAAIYAKPNSELDFARKLATLIDNPALREKMGREGRERIEHELAWPFQAKKLLAAYRRLGLEPIPIDDGDGSPPKTPEEKSVYAS